MDNYCETPGCDRLAYYATTKECATHYSRRVSGSSEMTTNLLARPTCSVSDCELQAMSRSEGAMCDPHYQQQWRGKDPALLTTSSKPDCWVAECEKVATTKKLCSQHYRAVRRGRLKVPDSLGVTVADPCAFPDCGRPQEAKGYCHGHGGQLREGVELTPLRPWNVYIRSTLDCLVEGCQGRSRSAHQLCKKHGRGVTEYKLSVDGVVELFRNARCNNLGCPNTTNLHIDHCHDTGNVRGLLCAGCNLSLGRLKEDVERIRGLADYLESRV